MTHFIAGSWCGGDGANWSSTDPATGAVLWSGAEATGSQVADAVEAAKLAGSGWALTPLEERIRYLEIYRDLLKARLGEMAGLIAREAGKTLWDATGEATAMANKIDISVKAYHDRTPTRDLDMGALTARLTHRPHGVMAVFGPYNFPGHLPNGHIVPALLAGNTIVYKPSEVTPAVAELMIKLLIEAGLPAGVVNLVQGGRETGSALVADTRIDGLLFTGSVQTGRILSHQLADRPGVIQALELGGNNPLIVHKVADTHAAAVMTILSGYVSSGQRCTCARRLIVPSGAEGDAFLEELAHGVRAITVGAWSDASEAFMGPLVSEHAADTVMQAYEQRLALGARPVVPMERMDRGPAFLRPGLIDVTGVDVEDEEVFGPLLQVVRVPNFEAAIEEANNTRYGLASGLISDDEALFNSYYPRAKAGIINWNQQLTGAASTAPFGGIGLSGNYRPSAYYAADYSAYAVASMFAKSGKAEVAAMPKGLAWGDNK